MINIQTIAALFLLFLVASCQKCATNTGSGSLPGISDTLVIRDTVRIADTSIQRTGSPILGPLRDLLYINCANRIVVDAPQSSGRLQVSATGAEVFPDASDDRVFTVIPSGSSCDFTVSTVGDPGDQQRWNTQFRCINVPRPGLDLLVNGVTHNGLNPIAKQSNCTIRVKPDAEFAASNPRDARYRITSVELLAQRSLGAPTLVTTINGIGRDAVNGVPVNLGNLLRSDPPGTRIYFRIKGLQRINERNSASELSLPEREMILSAVIK